MKSRIISLALTLLMLLSPALVAATTPPAMGLPASGPMPCVAAPVNDAEAPVPVPQVRCIAAKIARAAACAYYGEDSPQCAAARVAEGIACMPGLLPPGGGGGRTCRRGALGGGGRILGAPAEAQWSLGPPELRVGDGEDRVVTVPRKSWAYSFAATSHTSLTMSPGRSTRSLWRRGTTLPHRWAKRTGSGRVPGPGLDR